MPNLLRLLCFCLLSLLPAGIAFAQDPDTTLWVINGSVRTLARNGNTAYLGGDFTYLGRRTGGGAMLNTSDGQLTNHRSLNIRGQVMSAVSDGAGGWYIGGNFTQVQGVTRKGIAHILPDNTLDAAWNPDITFQNVTSIWELLYWNHTLYLCGGITAVNGVGRRTLAAIDGTTGRVTGWAPNPDGHVSALLAVGNVIYAGGAFTAIGGKPMRGLAALDATTGLAKDWTVPVSGGVGALAHLNGTLYFAGGFETVGGKPRRSLAAVDIASATVTDWQVSFGGVDIYSMVAHNNAIYVRGWFDGIGGKVRKNIAAIDAVTGVVTDWNPQGMPFVNPGKFAIVNNTVYLGGGYFDRGSSGFVGAINATTGERVSWDTGADGIVDCVAASENAIFAGGWFNSAGGRFRKGLGAIDLSLGQVTTWNPAPSNAWINKVVVADGLVYVGGSFRSIGGQERGGLAAVDTATGRATGWNPDLYRVFPDGLKSGAEVKTIVLHNGLVYAGGAFSHAGSDERTNIVALDGRTGKATGWKPDANRTVHSLLIARNLVYAGGEFTSIGGKPKHSLATLNLSTGLATPWTPIVESRSYEDTEALGTSRVYSQYLLGNRLVVSGYLNHVNGQKRNAKAAFDSFTGQLLPWNPDAPGEVLSAVVNDVMYAWSGVPAATPFDAATGKTTAWNVFPVSAFRLGIHKVLEDQGCFYLEGLGNSIAGPRAGDYVKYFAINPYDRPGANVPVNLIRGRITQAGSEHCLADPSARGLPDMVVVAEPGPYYGLSDSAGHYTIAVDTGAYTIRQLLPKDESRLVTQTCPAAPGAHAVVFKTYNNTVAGKDFGNRVTLRPYLTAGVTSARRRRCFPGNTTLTYCNAGSIAAGDVKMHLELPPHVVLVRADATFTVAPDGHYVFAVGSLAPGACGTIGVVDSVVCNNPDIRGLTQCTKVWITPANPATPAPGWDQSDMAVKAKCMDNGRVRASIHNAGTGTMTDSSAYRIYLDAKLALSRKFMLAAGDSLVLQVPANGQTVRVEADQRPGHPTKKSTNASIEACGTNAGGTASLGFVAQLPGDDAEPEVDVECLPITDSFDPNDKLVLPTGVSPDHHTAFGQELEYTVRFQNTGNDYAYQVVVTDTLSEKLDLTTLRVTGASHRYRFSVSGKGRPVLTWTFDNINLPDSARDQAGSNGFVKFTIKPVAGLAEYSRIENFADIFFDYNPPVRTNTVHNTLYEAPRETTGGDAPVATVCLPNLPVTAGENRAFCAQDTVRLAAGRPRYGNGRWKLVSGAGRIGDVNDPHAWVTHLGYGVNTFGWSIPDGNCAMDSLHYRVTVTRHPAPEKPTIAHTGVNELLCSTEGDAYQWYCQGTPLPDRTRTIRATRGGSYSVSVTRAHCTSDPSDPLDFRLTSPVLGLLARLYPNPTNGTFTLTLPAGTTRATISVFDALGKKVLEGGTTGTGDEPVVQELRLAGCGAGVYLVKIQTAEAVVVKRVLLR
jgi:uncharacterized repeat protein (TIGR01451 family)